MSKNKAIVENLYYYILKQRFEVGKNLFYTLAQQGIKYAIHKGAMLSKMLYGNYTTRISGDVDFLLSRDDSSTVKQILECEGFIQGRVVNGVVVPYTRSEIIFQASQTHQLAPFVKAMSIPFCPYVEYDFNVDIFWGESGKHTDMHHFLKHTQETMLFNIPVSKLVPEAEFIALCMHHYKDLNSIYLLWIKGFDERKICEISKYIETVPLDIDLLINLCIEYEVGDYVCCCAHYVNLLFPNRIAKLIEELLISEKSCWLYECFGLDDHERKIWSVPLSERAKNTRDLLEPLLTEEDRKKIYHNLQMM